MKEYRLTDWLPTTKKEVELRGWDELDVILFSGDAYVDHPSFGAAVIGRILEAEGLRVAIVPQPNWRDDLRDFRKLGRPRLFFGISAGCMDSMVNKYTANKRLRSDDAYTPDGRPDMRPEYPSIVYTQILKKLYPDVPVVLGGIEASMRRLSHYDYWQDRLKKSILCESGADMLIYGMGEKPICELVRRLTALCDNQDGVISSSDIHSPALSSIPQTAYLTRKYESDENDITLYSHEECLADKKKQATNFRHIEEESNKYAAARIVQAVDGKTVVVNPPYPPMTEKELDRSFDLPYTRLPHPKYKGKRIPAYDMIKFSVNIHRGCFGGCAFCTISAHQGKFIVSRSKESILKEVKEVKRARLTEYAAARPSAQYHEGRGVWQIKCDIALPCATQNELLIDDAKALVANGVTAVCEGANMPTTLEATKYLQDNGVLFVCGKASNAGGVATSALEMTQNSERLSWTFDEVNEKLEQIMINIYHNIDDAAKRYGMEGNYVAGANIAGFEKVANAMLAQGVC